METEMFKEFEKVQEIIEKADYKAVHSGIALGGLSIEAFQKEDDCILRVVSVDDNNHVDVVYARITEEDFDDLSMQTEPTNCNATDFGDARVIEAARDWVADKEGYLVFYKVGSGQKNGKMIPSDFSL